MLNLNYIKYEMHDDGIAFINLNNKPVNALSIELIEELENVIEHLYNEPKCRLIIFRSLQKHFSAGADLKQRKKMTIQKTHDFLDKINKVFNKIQNFPMPTIASINGAALGGGLELALCCDFRVASDNAYVGLPETSLGIIPGAGGIIRLSNLIGLSKSKYWIFTAQKFSSESAHDDGVIDFISKDNELLGVTLEIAQEILDNAPLALKASKNLFNKYIETSAKLYGAQKECYESVINSEDKIEAINAFLDKRKPLWKNK